MLPLLCIAMLLITFALATWALVEGVHGVHQKVDDFWAIEQSIRDQVRAWGRVAALRRHHLVAEGCRGIAAHETEAASVPCARRSRRCARMSSLSSAA